MEPIIVQSNNNDNYVNDLNETIQSLLHTTTTIDTKNNNNYNSTINDEKYLINKI